MCGIVYTKRKGHRASKPLLKRFENQKARGTQGFGFISIKDDKISLIERSSKEKDIIDKLKECNDEEILFHHRFPTSTPNLPEQTHPITVKNDLLKSNYYVAHNGVITNAEELKFVHEKLGFKYTTDLLKTVLMETKDKTYKDTYEFFNDSEAFAIELALFLDGKQEKIDTRGSIAFIAIETDKKDNILNIHFGRNSGNPLVVEELDNMFCIKSTGQGAEVEENKIWTINHKTDMISSRDVSIGERIYAGFRKQTKWTQEKGWDNDEEEEIVIGHADTCKCTECMEELREVNDRFLLNPPIRPKVVELTKDEIEEFKNVTKENSGKGIVSQYFKKRIDEMSDEEINEQAMDYYLEQHVRTRINELENVLDEIKDNIQVAEEALKTKNISGAEKDYYLDCLKEDRRDQTETLDKLGELYLALNDGNFEDVVID